MSLGPALMALFLGYVQATVQNGSRASSSSAYLTTSVLARPNLHILLNAQVTKLIQGGSSKDKPVFRTIQYEADGSTPIFT
jgi:choline dehydrogenase-like flavoprotein